MVYRDTSSKSLFSGSKIMKDMICCVHFCPSGLLNDSQKACGCSPGVVTKYQKRISDPLLDRIDIHIAVPRVDYEKLSGDRLVEPSEVIRKRVQAARDIHRASFSEIDSKHPIFCNTDMRVGEIRQFCRLQDEGQTLMRAAMTQLNFRTSEYIPCGDDAISTYCVVPVNISGTGNRRKMVLLWMPIASPGRCAGFVSRLFLAW